ATEDGTAIAGTNYQSASAGLVYYPGSSSTVDFDTSTFYLSGHQTTLTFSVNLQAQLYHSENGNWTITDTWDETATVTILDHNSPPTAPDLGTLYVTHDRTFSDIDLVG